MEEDITTKSTTTAESLQSWLFAEGTEKVVLVIMALVVRTVALVGVDRLMFKRRGGSSTLLLTLVQILLEKTVLMCLVPI